MMLWKTKEEGCIFPGNPTENYKTEELWRAIVKPEVDDRGRLPKSKTDML